LIREEVVIVNAMGLHARAAARFVQVASRYHSRIQVSRDGSTADGKSILSLLALIGSTGTRLTIEAEGPDAVDAVRALCALVAARFGEAQ
jgi:phosphocarrier protein